jgi:hypothetical protein
MVIQLIHRLQIKYIAGQWDCCLIRPHQNAILLAVVPVSAILAVPVVLGVLAVAAAMAQNIP